MAEQERAFSIEPRPAPPPPAPTVIIRRNKNGNPVLVMSEDEALDLCLSLYEHFFGDEHAPEAGPGGRRHDPRPLRVNGSNDEVAGSGVPGKH